MEKKSVKLNYFYNLTYEVLLLLTPLITTPYVSRVLGADGVGEYSYTSSIVYYFALFALLGTARYGQREIACSQDDCSERSRKFVELEILTLSTTLISLICFCIFLYFNGFPAIYIVQVFTILSSFVDITWFFQGMEEFGKIALRNIIFRIISLVSIFLFVRDTNDTVIYAFIMVFWVFIGHISLWLYLPKYIDIHNLKGIKPWRHIIPTLRLFIPAIAVSIYTVLDRTMIGVITGSNAENGYYEQAYKLSKIMLTIITSLGTIILPKVAYYFEHQDYQKTKNFMYNAYKFVWLMGIPMCLGLIGIADNFVPWFFGDSFLPAIPTIKLMSGLLIIVGLSNMTGYEYLVGTKRENLFTLSVVIGAITNFVLNLIFIRPYGAFGATIATVLAESVIAGIQFYLIRKELSFKKILAFSLKSWIAGLIMFAIILFENYLFSPSIINTVIMILTGVIIYAFLLFVLKDQFFIDNVQRILHQLLERIHKKQG